LKEASRRTVGRLAGALAILAMASCQSILGIHGGTLLDDAGSEPASGGTSGGGMIGPDHTGGHDAAGGAGSHGGTGSSSGGKPTEGRDGSAGNTAAKDASAPDDARIDADGASPADSPVVEPPSDGGSDRMATPDAGSCTTPWSLSGVRAQLLNVDPATSTACSLPANELPTLAAGVDRPTFRGSAACGACLRVQLAGGSASVVVSVVELSGATGILLSRGAMDQLSPGASQAMVDWTLVPCEVGDTLVSYRIKDGTNPGYLGVQIRNTRYPLASVNVVGSAGLIPLTLRSYNYWESSAAGAGPVTFRLTDVNGQSFDDPGIRLTPNTEVPGQRQFPLCH